MAAVRVGNIEWIESTMDRFGYLNILKQMAEKLGLSSTYYFQQDNYPKHTADRSYGLCNASKLLKIPPQSPHLNPGEHLWVLLE